MLNITKNIDIYNLVKIDEIINYLLNEKINININNLNLENIKKSSEYSKLDNNEKEILETNYKKYNNLNNFGFFKCMNCEYFENIENGTIILNNNRYKSNNSDLKLKLQATNNILPRTRDYICQNSNCRTNKELVKDKEAVFYRNDITNYKLNYLCTICNHNWEIN
tara:strand:+ start:1637 stop:2134 length:498 start_codon:yes stop_codon:yes gene_type:complete